MSDHFDCPLCDWTLDVPAGDDPVMAGAIAAVMGVPADAFTSIRDHQRKRRLEVDLDRHLRTHGPDEWLPALMDARRTCLELASIDASRRRTS